MAEILQNLLAKADLLIVFIGMAVLQWYALSTVRGANTENLSLTQMLAKLLAGRPPDPAPIPVQPKAPPSPPAPPVSPPKTPLAPTTSDRFGACMAFVWPEEGGFSNDPQDHGGPTNLGVTLPDLERAGLPATLEELKGLTKDSAAARIYRPFYWNAMHCDELPAGVDLEVFDLGINAGIHEAAKLLQGAVGAVQDGVVGPKTIAAVHTKQALEIIQAFDKERTTFYKSLKQFDRFGRDWLKRTADCLATATKMAQAG